MFVCLNGKFLKAHEAKISVLDHGFLYGDGVYETLRTCNGKIWQLKEHLKRLERSAAMIGLCPPVAVGTIGKWTEQLVRKNGFAESRIRITLTRGANGFDFTSLKKPTLLIQAEELVPQPPGVYKKGVKVVTIHIERTVPAMKSISLLPMVVARQKMGKAYEALLVDHKGYVREGTITNVFMVKNGVLWTPAKHILHGTTRDYLLKLVRKERMKIRVQDFTLRKLLNAEEVFLTNAPRGIIPVRQVDTHQYGKPGPVTQHLMKIFDESLRKTCG